MASSVAVERAVEMMKLDVDMAAGVATREKVNILRVDEHLSADDQAYHSKLIADMNTMQAMWNHWVAHLSEKYKLQQGDQIAPDGLITRQRAPAAAEESAS